MFSTCRGLQTGLILLALGACSPQAEPPQTPTQSDLPQGASTQSAPIGPAVVPGSDATAATRTISSRMNAAGIEATYTATFGDGERVRITEQRADSRNGEYEFRGARLLHYSGGGVTQPAAIEIRFDLQGRVELAQSGSGPVTPEEISAIRQRAQLLRSHALAQQAAGNHY